MEHKKLLRRFRLRLLGHCLLRSALWGLACGAAAVFICSLVWHILLKAPSAVWLPGSLGAGFILGFVPCFIAYFPTRKRTAKRLDETGLQERAGTMLAYAKKDGLMVQLQRRDAAAHIEKTETKTLRMAFPYKVIICCIVCIALAATMVLLPYDLFAPRSDKTPEDVIREQQIHQLIDDLRQQIRDAELNEAAQRELDALLAQLEQDLLNADNELEQAALIAEAQQNIGAILTNTISRHAIGKALQGYSLTENLGIKLTSENPHDISVEMDEMENQTYSPTKQTNRLKNNILNALEDSGIEPGDILHMAFSRFAELLDGLNHAVEGPEHTPTWTRDDLSFIFEIAEADILAALEEQAHDEAEVENLDGTIRYELNSLLGQEGGDELVQPGQNGQQSNQSGNNNSGGSDGNPAGTPVGGMFDSGDSNSGPTTMLEGIYDPVSGSVSYGEVFAAYYAQYLEALDAGEIPEELRPYFEKYFSSLS